MLVSEDLGGKVNYRFTLKGFEGHEIITGANMVEKFQRRLEYLHFAHQLDHITQIVPEGEHFSVLAQSGNAYQARAAVIATGATPQSSNVPGEKRLLGRGLSYSATSHAQLFIEKEAALLGSNGRALRSAAELANVARRVHLLLPERGEMGSSLGQRLRSCSNVTLYENAELLEIHGEAFVERIVLRSQGEIKEIPVDGLFIELGLVPNSQLVASLGVTDSHGRIVVDCKCATPCPGLFAAGDVTDMFTEQVLISIGEGDKAIALLHTIPQDPLFLRAQEGKALDALEVRAKGVKGRGWTIQGLAPKSCAAI